MWYNKCVARVAPEPLQRLSNLPQFLFKANTKGGVYMKKINLLSQNFGNLSVISEYSKPNSKRKYWLCKCECGNTTIVNTTDLKSGHTKSCGCLKTKNNSTTTRNSIKANRLYNIWRGMKKRCYLPTNKDYKNYGGRGISVCDEWKNSFLTFYEWSMFNGYSDALTLDRIDVNGNYEPTNCRWVTMKMQQQNRRNNLYITHNEQSKSLSEWCEILNYPYKKAKERCHTLKRSNKPITFESVFDL